MNIVTVGDYKVGQGHPMVLLAGPCVLEGYERSLMIGKRAKAIADKLGMPYVFKASYDKANRSSYSSFRGPGLKEGLAILAQIKKDLGVPIVTDVHETYQVEPAAEVADILQIPAFLCRQTDLVYAAGKTGRTVNVKKGQFLAPWDMKNVIKKIEESGNKNIMLTERGASFGYNGNGYARPCDYARTGLPGSNGRYAQRADSRRAGYFLRRAEPVCAAHGKGSSGCWHRRTLLRGARQPCRSAFRRAEHG